MPTRILSIDTSSSQCLVALRPYDDATIISESREGAREHAAVLLPLIDALMAQAQLSLSDLDAISFARGPGSFTGVRLAACAVQGLAYGAGLPVVAVSSLAALAQSAALQQSDGAAAADIMVAVNAHMGELFTAHFCLDKTANSGLYCSRKEEKLLAEEGLTAWLATGELEAAAPVIKVGNGWALAAIEADVNSMTTAEGLLRQVEAEYARAGGMAPDRALPAYLRGADAWQKTAMKAVLKS